MEAEGHEFENYLKENIPYDSGEHRVVSACNVTGLKFKKRNTWKRMSWIVNKNVKLSRGTVS